MTSIRNISRGVGLGMVGLGLIASLSAGGCGGPDSGGGTDSSFVDPGLGPGSQTVETELTKVSYQFGPGGLPVGPNATFVDVALRDAGGAIVQEQRFPIAASAQVSVADVDVAKITNTTVDVVLPDGSIREHFEKAISLTKNQTTLVSSATASTAVLNSLRVTTLDEQGFQSIEDTGTLLMVTGTAYPLILLGNYTAGTTTALANITGGTLTSSNTSVVVINNGVLSANTTITGATANVNGSFQNRTTSLPVLISGISAPSPTPTPAPSASPVASPSPGASPTASASPSPSPSPSGTPSISNVLLFLGSNTIVNGQSTPFGVNATVNGTSVNVTSIPGVTLSATSSNTTVAVVNLQGQTINAVGVGQSIISATVTVPGVGSANATPQQVTVTP